MKRVTGRPCLVLVVMPDGMRVRLTEGELIDEPPASVFFRVLKGLDEHGKEVFVNGKHVSRFYLDTPSPEQTA